MGRAYRVEKKTSHVYVELGSGARAMVEQGERVGDDAPAVLDDLVHQVFDHLPLGQAGVLKLIQQPVIISGIETEVDTLPRRAIEPALLCQGCGAAGFRRVWYPKRPAGYPYVTGGGEATRASAERHFLRGAGRQLRFTVEASRNEDLLRRRRGRHWWHAR